MGQRASRAICFLFPTVPLGNRSGIGVRSGEEVQFAQFNILQPVFCTSPPPTRPLLITTVSTDPSAGAPVIRAAAEVIRSAAENADYELVTRILIACALVAQRSLANSNI